MCSHVQYYRFNPMLRARLMGVIMLFYETKWTKEIRNIFNGGCLMWHFYCVLTHYVTLPCGLMAGLFWPVILQQKRSSPARSTLFISQHSASQQVKSHIKGKMNNQSITFDLFSYLLWILWQSTPFTAQGMWQIVYCFVICLSCTTFEC